MQADHGPSPYREPSAAPAVGPLAVALAVAGPPVLAALVAAAFDLSTGASAAVWLVGVACAVAATWVRVVRPLVHDLAGARIAAEDAALRTAALRATVDVRDRFDRAVAITDGEPALLRLALRAAGDVVPDHDVELLLSLPDEPRVAWSLRLVDGELAPATPVAGRPGCAALATGRTSAVESTDELGACDHLGITGEGASGASAVCIPLPLGDRMLGALCVTGPPGGVPGTGEIDAIDHVVATTGRRLEEIRRRRGPSRAGPTDPVTGLPTGAALRSSASELVRTHQPFCIAVLRLDGSAAYRDDHGAAAWDDALRLLGDTTTTTLRPDDVVCRLDDDRIGAVLANCSTVQAAAAMERVRESLVLALTVAGVAHFTCSAGLVDGARGTSIDQAVQLADAAGEAALLQGGNRVVVADASTT